MAPYSKHFHSKKQSGNAMIYVLVIVALFAALSFVLARHSGTAETGELSSQKIEIDAANILQTAAQMKQALDQMNFSGSSIASLDFTTPDDEPAFSAGSKTHKFFHPAGGNAGVPRLPEADITQVTADPPAGWYIGRFNNTEWTGLPVNDVMLTAFQITKPLCQEINKKLTGSTAIPVATVSLRNVLIAASHHTGANADFTVAACGACDGLLSLCVEDPGNNLWAFYSILAPQ